MNLSLQLLFHGAIVLLIGQLSGIPYGSAITKKKDEEIVRAWKVAHSGLSMGGTTMIAFAAAINQLDMNVLALAILVWSSVISGYGFCIALPYGAWVGHRGLSVGKTIENKIVYAGNIVGATGSLISTLTLIFGCLQSMAIFS
ncbi:hypothetical protein [Pleurocapsa sp. PCC 7319]|uniref:hypothetical protein n=1 Tax=Pleurocapsa sp. PCC 7319 TaxID=118161 RepID=UPI00034AEC90|nr:hypothetical protein [Pleurocapsa sp. PCC 7319]